MKKFINNLLCDLCASIYEKKIEKNIFKINDIGNLSYFLIKNRLQHQVVQLDQNYRIILAEKKSWSLEYTKYQDALKASIKFLFSELDYHKPIVIKTFANFNYRASDLDILDCNLKREQHIAVLKGLPLHIQGKISWLDADAISNDFALNNLIEKRVFAKRVLVPNADFDYLLRVGHIAFEVAEIRLSELLYLFSIAEKVDFKKLLNEVEKMKWLKTYSKLQILLNSLHYQMYGLKLIQDVEVLKNIKIDFPFNLPLLYLASAVIEKRAWKKIFGARFIIKDRVNHFLKQ